MCSAARTIAVRQPVQVIAEDHVIMLQPAEVRDTVVNHPNYQ